MNRDPARIPIMLEALQTLWNANPDWRLGQLICNLRDPKISDIFYQEDDVTLARLKEPLS